MCGAHSESLSFVIPPKFLGMDIQEYIFLLPGVCFTYLKIESSRSC